MRAGLTRPSVAAIRAHAFVVRSSASRERQGDAPLIWRVPGRLFRARRDQTRALRNGSQARSTSHFALLRDSAALDPVTSCFACSQSLDSADTLRLGPTGQGLFQPCILAMCVAKPQAFGPFGCLSSFASQTEMGKVLPTCWANRSVVLSLAQGAKPSPITPQPRVQSVVRPFEVHRAQTKVLLQTKDGVAALAASAAARGANVSG